MSLCFSTQSLFRLIVDADTAAVARLNLAFSHAGYVRGYADKKAVSFRPTPRLPTTAEFCGI